MNASSKVCLLIVFCGLSAGSARAQRTAPDHARDLRSNAPAIRAQAVLELGRRADKSAVSAISQALKDSEPQVRREAARALGAIKDAEAVPALIAAARDSDKNVRAYAAYALGEIKDDRATDALLQAFRDPEWCVRDQAAWALREIRDPKIAGSLAATLKHESADVAAVAWLLRSLGDRVAVESLVPLLRQGTATARLQAVRALSALKSEGAIDPLLAALKDNDPNVRFSAVEALAKSSDPRVSKAFKAALAGESDQRIRAVMEGLVRQASHEQELAAWWSFDDRNPGIAKDVTGHGNDGEIKGATPVEGRVGAALRCGKGKFVSLGKVPKLPIAKSPLTVMAWVKSEAKTGVVVARGGAFCGFSLYLKDGAPRFGIRRNQQDSIQIAIGKQEVGGDWTHLAGVIKNDALELHVNGKLVAATKTEGYISGNCGQGMEIGCDLGNSPAEITDAFDGLIDEVKVFRAALTEEEIAEHCAAPQLTGKELKR